MLRITVELWPHGHEHLRRTIGTIFVTNTRGGSRTFGNYHVERYSEPPSPLTNKEPRLLKRGWIERHPRKLNVWELVARAIDVTRRTRRSDADKA